MDQQSHPAIPSRDAIVVSLYNQGLKGSEIAARAGIKLGSLSTRLYDLRQRGLIGRRNKAKAATSPSQDLAAALKRYHRAEQLKAAAADLQAFAAKLIALYMAGASRKAMAAETGKTISQVEFRLAKLRASGAIPQLQPVPAPAPAAPAVSAAPDSDWVSPNAWPGGPREIACGNPDCRRQFISEHKGVRRCTPCRAMPEGADLQSALSLGGKVGSRSWMPR